VNAEELAKILQDLLVRAMDRWNASHTLDPLRKLPWENLDPVSRTLYIERCAEFLERFDVRPKHMNFPRG
jgi:hypothetical protein